MSQSSQKPPLQRPMNLLPGTTVDTSPESLGLPTIPNIDSDDPPDGSTALSRPSSGNFVKRTMEKLSRSATRSRPATADDATAPSPGHRRLFSLSRRNKDGGIIDEKGSRTDSSQTSEQDRNKREHEITSSALLSSNYDTSNESPFIRPASPIQAETYPTRPSILNFRGTGSMRAGTQTLIQALQALPWTEEAGGEEEDVVHSADSQTDTDEEEPGPSSSIHALYRPVSHARRTPPSPQPPGNVPEYFDENGAVCDRSSSPDEFVEGDFEAKPITHVTPGQVGSSPPMPMVRAGSMATVRLQRRARLASKLREVFEVDDLVEVVAEIPCWLLRSVLLQGYIYLTNAHFCFFAHIPSREDQVLKSGSLQKKSRPKRWTKFWFILKNDALFWYNSSADPYFPQGVMNLRYAISCDTWNERGLRLRANDRTITLLADSSQSRDEWIKAIRKVIFKAQNTGESVKIVIPYSLVIDVEKSSALDFSETIEVKVMEKATGFSIDSYFFAYFRDPTHALEQIRDVVRTYKQSSTSEGMIEVKDTTSKSSSQDQSTASPKLIEKSLPLESKGSFRISALLKPFSGTSPIHRPEMPGFPESEPAIVHANSSPLPRHDDLSSSVHTLTARASSMPLVPTDTEQSSKKHPSSTLPVSEAGVITASIDHTYPPPPSPGPYPFPEHQSSWNATVPSWLRVPGRRVFSSINFLNPGSSDRVREVYSPGSLVEQPLEDTPHGNMGFSLIDHKEATIDPEIIDKFRLSFALDEKETLLGFVPGYLFRVLPVSGKFYISTSHLCFRSSQPLAKTRMIIPMRDILTSEPTKGYRFGMHGLVLIIKGHEELFFEFGSSVRRDQFIQLLTKQIEGQRGSSLASPVSREKREALFLEELDVSHSLTDSLNGPTPENQAESLPAVMFTSSSSTFLTFKPKEPLHFTCLTIGSRGDVQPYIALGKKLLEEGHRVRIATHKEFKEWIESYGIEFAYVGGDPAELMRICVENGMFTVSFLKESVAKFRGWIDDLLKTSWDACQGTDVLIESPSAMGGIHIAEALKIPYFRAFTMPWTRTRAYPHAFAVPERKMGGTYNYMTYVMFDQVFWRGTSSQINRWRRKVLGLSGIGLDKMEQHKIPFLYNFSSAVVPPPLDWYEWIRVTGYWFLEDADVSIKKWTPPPDLVEFIDAAHALGKKVVYVGFGSIVVSDPEAMTRCVVEAILKSGVYAVLSKGWSDRLAAKKPASFEDHTETFPPQIYPITSIPHDWLFSRIDVACHHGGAGTTGASLRAGIPTIIKPFFGDQFFWGDRVEALGVGSSVRKLTVDHLASALITATTDSRQILKAKTIGQIIRAEDGAGKAVESIYRDLEYARSLIKRNDDSDLEQGHYVSRPPSCGAGAPSSCGSARPASEDWSVISDQDDHHRTPLHHDH